MNDNSLPRGIVDVDADENAIEAEGPMDEQKVLCVERVESPDGSVRCAFKTVEKALSVPQIECTVSYKGDLPWKQGTTYAIKISL